MKATHQTPSESAPSFAIENTCPTIRAYVAGDFKRPAESSRAPAGNVTLLDHFAKWLTALQGGLGYEPYLFLAERHDASTAGFLPLCLVRSTLFGRFLVSLPYISSAGVVADDQSVSIALVDEAVRLADRLAVDYVVLRHEQHIPHPALSRGSEAKVHMRLRLPDSAENLWKDIGPKVRNQVRKGEKHGLVVEWGTHGLLRSFYEVFARNMRDLGTPVFGRNLFRSILDEFDERAELCVVRHGKRNVAAALLIHTAGTTELPSASSLRQFNYTNANMLMYWHLLRRSIERRQATLDFGRSTPDSGTFRFKKQWGALPTEAIWQYYIRHGDPGGLRPDSPKYRAAVRVWQHLPVWLTRLMGPPIVRGIP